MSNNRDGRRRPRMEAVVQARCAWCGGVEFEFGELRVHAKGDDLGLLEFRCPSCGRLNVRPLGGPELAALSGLGATPTASPGPFELLEEHDGPPITWDDLIDFHEAVSRADADADWLRGLREADVAVRGADLGRERDAA
ncbi:MAG TPA: hypothetical protein VF972_07425 [Actinomycetota bacterium]